MAHLSYPVLVAQKNAIAFWQLNEGPSPGHTGVIDSQGGYNSSVVGASVVFNQNGLIGDASNRSAWFDGSGNSYIGISHNAALQPTNISIEAIFRPHNFSHEGAIISKKESGGYALEIDQNNTTLKYGLRFSIRTNGIDYSIRLEDDEFDITVPFMHVICTFDGTYMRMYVNGIRYVDYHIGSTSNSMEYSFNNTLVIGQEATTGGPAGQRPFRGHIDSVALYNYALSQNDATALFISAGTYVHTIWNKENGNANFVVSDGNKTAYRNTSGNGNIRSSTYFNIGKKYVEFFIHETDSPGSGGIGLCKDTLATGATLGPSDSLAFHGTDTLGSLTGNSTSYIISNANYALTKGTIIGFAIDFDNNRFWARYNGEWTQGNPISETLPYTYNFNGDNFFLATYSSGTSTWGHKCSLLSKREDMIFKIPHGFEPWDDNAQPDKRFAILEDGRSNDGAQFMKPNLFYNRSGSSYTRSHALSAISHIRGKKYFEAILDSSDPDVDNFYLGIVRSGDILDNQDTPDNAGMWSLRGNGTGKLNGSNLTGSNFTGFSPGDIVGIAYDIDNGNMWYSVNGSWVDGDPALDTDPTASSITTSNNSMFFFASIDRPGVAGEGTAQFKTREDEFEYSVPSGFEPWGAVNEFGNANGFSDLTSKDDLEIIGNIAKNKLNINGQISVARSRVGHNSGKRYVEFVISKTAGSTFVGISSIYHFYNYSLGTTTISTGNSVGLQNNGQVVYDNSVLDTYSIPDITDKIIGMAVDMDEGKIFFSIDGVWQGGANPVAGVNPAAEEAFLAQDVLYPSVSRDNPQTICELRDTAGTITYQPPRGYTIWNEPEQINREMSTWSSGEITESVTTNSSIKSPFGASSGVRYFEVKYLDQDNSGNASEGYMAWIGVGKTSFTSGQVGGAGTDSFVYLTNRAAQTDDLIETKAQIKTNNIFQDYGLSFYPGDRIGVLVNFETREISFYLNGIFQGLAFAQGQFLEGDELFPIAGTFSSSGNSDILEIETNPDFAPNGATKWRDGLYEEFDTRLNSLDKSGNTDLYQSGLYADIKGNGAVRATHGHSSLDEGSYYFEYENIAPLGPADPLGGLASLAANINTTFYSQAEVHQMYFQDGDYYPGVSAYGDQVLNGEFFGVLYTPSIGEVRFFVNGVDQGVIPATLRTDGTKYFPCVSGPYSSGSAYVSDVRVNFGREPFKYKPAGALPWNVRKISTNLNPTWDPRTLTLTSTLDENNHLATVENNHIIRGIIGVDATEANHYFEIEVVSGVVSYLGGLTTGEHNPTSQLGSSNKSWGMDGNERRYHNGSLGDPVGDSFYAGTIIGYHLHDGILDIYHDGVKNPLGFTGIAGIVYPAWGSGSNNTNHVIGRINMGDSSFAYPVNDAISWDGTRLATGEILFNPTPSFNVSWNQSQTGSDIILVDNNLTAKGI